MNDADNVLFNSLARSVLMRTAPRCMVFIAAFRKRLKERLQVDCLTKLVDTRKVCIDVGAHYGVITYFLSRLSRHVFAYEPNAECYTFLTRSVARNVTVLLKGVSHETGLMEFYVPVHRKRDFSAFASLGKSWVAGVSTDFETRVIETVILDQANYADVGFIKIDVEGHEKSVVKGAHHLISSQRPSLMIEISDDNVGLVGEIIDMGYKASRLQGDTLATVNGKTTVGGDFIFINADKKVAYELRKKAYFLGESGVGPS